MKQRYHEKSIGRIVSVNNVNTIFKKENYRNYKARKGEVSIFQTVTDYSFQDCIDAPFWLLRIAAIGLFGIFKKLDPWNTIQPYTI